MTRAVFNFSGGLITGFEMKGHTGAQRQGKDILCAFISGAAETAVNTITDSFHISAKITVKKDGARVICRLTDADDAKKRAFDRIAGGLRLTLTQLSKKYPDGLSVFDSGEISSG